jgi:hypothetical protein
MKIKCPFKWLTYSFTIISAANEIISDVEFDCSKAVDMGYISPKLLELIKLFETFGYATTNSLFATFSYKGLSGGSIMHHNKLIIYRSVFAENLVS